MKSRILLILALITALPCAYSQTQKNKIDYKTQSYDLVFDRPNCILSVIPMESLPKIKSLTIRGELGNDDVSIIFDKCTDLEYLDLKNTNLKTFSITDYSKVSKLRVFKMPSRITWIRISISGNPDKFGDLFKDCYNLENVELPSGLELVNCNLFNNCPKIQTIVFPSSVKEIVCHIVNCRSLTTVDLSQCNSIKTNLEGWYPFRLWIEKCPNLKTVRYQSGHTAYFTPSYDEPSGVSYYFSSNKCAVAYYENCTLIFKGEANNDKKNPVKNCTIFCPKSMMTHFYVEFNGNNNRLIGLNEITETEIKKTLQIEQRRRDKEQIERERLEKEGRKQEEERRKQEEERRKQEEKRRKQETDSIAHINVLKTEYAWCRFLFETEGDFVSCISQEYSPRYVENRLKNLLDQKFEIVSKDVVDGKELYKGKNNSETELLKICYLCKGMNNTLIAEYAENKLKNFINERKTLAKAYNKAKKKDSNMKCSTFLVSYINGK